ncbi:hypothetical protein C7999DRAFT_41840 [Corynascus novoguineensis]|uniref:F-box domain-containing protein n=1 Tax=Corynascus novoguineensis TaxID=1126955 RepID=A0AAN7HMN6_9PEZI|nr:hypothetical protein C7999DRAFT_41840 [Corynascus novoguineensis]
MAASGHFVPSGQADLANGASEENDAKITAAIAQGKELTQKGDFSKALRITLDAVNMCPCDPAGNGKQRHRKDKSCNILQCMAALKSNDPDALYRIAQGPCACGYSWQSCTLPQHAVALDALADCLFRANQYTAALSTALATIRLDPASAVGYCRGVKILRHLLKNTSAQSSTAEARLTALIFGEGDKEPSPLDLRRLLDRFVHVALDITGRHRCKPKDSYNVVLQRMAFHMKCEIACRDPIKEFPYEVLTMIFSLLNTSSIIQCLGVNKQWNQFIIQNTKLWDDLRLNRPGNPGRYFPAFLQKHQGEIKSLVIRDTSNFQANAVKIRQILQGLPKLERLHLDSGKPCPHTHEVDLQLPRLPTTSWARLTQLSLVSFRFEKPVMQLLSFSKDTLTVLDLVNTGPFSSMESSPGVTNALDSIRLPKLKKLRIIQEYPMKSLKQSTREKIEMEPIVIATPNLEQLYLDGFIAYWRRGEPKSGKDVLWPSLRKLVLGAMQLPDGDFLDERNMHFLPTLPSTMESIEFFNQVCKAIAHHVLFHITPDMPITTGHSPPDANYESRHFPNLEVFRCISGIFRPDLLQRVLEPSAKAGKLKVLELAVTTTSLSLMPSASPYLRSDFVPARDLGALASENLHTLGLYDFNFFGDPTSRYGATDQFCGDPFIEWLDCFPKLHTVAVYPGKWQGVAFFITKLILHPKVKVIHQDCLRGADWYEAQKLAKKHRVALYHTPNHTPVCWPMIED